MSEAEEIRKIITLLESENLIEAKNMAAINQPGKKFLCRICGYVYSEALGDVMLDALPGTRWEDIPDELLYCPDCGHQREDFYEVTWSPSEKNWVRV